MLQTYLIWCAFLELLSVPPRYLQKQRSSTFNVAIAMQQTISRLKGDLRVFHFQGNANAKGSREKHLKMHAPWIHTLWYMRNHSLLTNKFSNSKKLQIRSLWVNYLAISLYRQTGILPI